MKRFILICVVLLTGVILSGCTTRPERDNCDSTLAQIRAVVNSHGSTLNNLISPYELHCTYVEGSAVNGYIDCISITGQLSKGTVAIVGFIPQEPPVRYNTRTFAGFLHTLETGKRDSVTLEFHKLKQALASNGCVIGESDETSIVVWTKEPQSANNLQLAK